MDESQYEGSKADLKHIVLHLSRFFFEYTTGNKVIARRTVSLIGYTQMDLGIAKCHFEIGAEKKNFEWIDNCVQAVSAFGDSWIPCR